MTFAPHQARLALGAFLVIGAGVAVNVLCLQDSSITAARGRATAEKVLHRAEIERQRSLALTPSDTPRKLPVARSGIPAAETQIASPTVERVGRFAPTAAQFSRVQMPETDADVRTAEMVRAVQRRLAERGYEPGSVDGVIGASTRAAVLAYEHDHRLPLTADPSEALLQHLTTGSLSSPAGKPKGARAPHAEHLVRTVQQSLSAIGYFAGRIDGAAGPDTVRAIREYEIDAGLVPTGRISSPLLQRLGRGTAPGQRPAR
jgi:peptidoglycan hydrolase-like protein with peptidoglycan-binding domain